jgi:site-specific DNA recombinase
MRAGIYARYSSDNQDERSIEDQLRLCRELAARRGDSIVEIYADYAISGSSLKTRPQALRLLAEAREGRIDVVITEALDRLSRDQEDVAGIFKRLAHAGVAIVTTSEGEINELHIGLKGTMNALFLKDLAAKVRRGQRGRIAAGKSAGGIGYGYRVVRALDAAGELKRGERAIDPAEAAIIRRIFAAAIAGTGARAIAAALNRDGVAAPFGRHWNASSIYGSPQRGTGILCNALYAGRLVYNRVRMVKDPDTGRRLSRANPPSEWVTIEAPALRIVPEEEWQAVQARRRAVAGVPVHQQRRPKHLLSGLACCGHCGGPYVIRSPGKLGCSRHHESGTCPNGRRIRVALLERRVLDGLKTKLLAPAAIRLAVATYTAERNRLAGESGERRRQLERRIARLGRDIDQGVDAILAGGAPKTLSARLVALEAEKEQAEAALERLTAAATDVVTLHPTVIESYTQAIEKLRDTLAAAPDDQAPAIAQLRQLIERVDVLPDESAPEGFQITAYGRLAELLAAAPGAGRRLKAVAGEGVEPPTLGL